MIILGIDPGTAVTGYGVIDRSDDGAVRLVECGVIRTSSKSDLADRLREIFEGITELMDRHCPEVVAVEGVFFAKNVRSAVVLGHARGAILAAAAVNGARVAEYPPAEVKSAVVGNGGAAKEQVQFMVRKLLRLAEVPRPADAADAVAVALCHCFRGFGPTGRTRLPIQMPRGIGGRM